MARPVKKTPEQWKEEILSAAKKLFLSKGYEETSVSDIMEEIGKGDVLPLLPHQGSGNAYIRRPHVFGKQSF